MLVYMDLRRLLLFLAAAICPLLAYSSTAFSYFSGTSGKWVFERGGFEIMAGPSSEDLRLRGSIRF